MKFTVHDVEHRSDDWFKLRLGRLTSSRAADAFRYRRDGKEAASRENLRVKLAVERITGEWSSEGEWSSAPMQRGLDMEADALAAYEAETGNLTTPAGLVVAEDVMAAASPDSMVNDFEGIVEAKAPLQKTHYNYLKSGKIPGDYLAQVRHLLWVTGAEWCDWFSWCPSFPEPIRLQLIRVTRDEADIDGYEEKVLEFLGELDVEEKLVREMAYGAAHAA